MSNVTQFFPGGSSGGSERKKNRRIFTANMVGLAITTTGYEWPVPPDVTEVEVHCWGAGGDAGNGGAATNASGNSAGGGGGGYVTHVFPVTSSDKLLIVCGASPGGTSSVSVPTQSPGSPISATGGSTGTGLLPDAGNPGAATGGAGGVGSYTIAPGISTSRTFAASGGFGGGNNNFAPPGGGTYGGLGGGGAAGSPFGQGGSGGNTYYAGGGGIGSPGSSAVVPTGAGGGSGFSSPPFVPNLGGPGLTGFREAFTFATPTTAVIGNNISNDNNDNWFYVDEILGAGGNPTYKNGGAGGGGAGLGGIGGILGGGGHGSGTPGGLAGGGGGLFRIANARGGRGGAGLVILYW